MFGIEHPEHVAERNGYQKSRRPPAQPHRRLHFRRKGIAAPQLQIQRSSNAKPDHAPIKEDEIYVLKYLLRFHKAFMVPQRYALFREWAQAARHYFTPMFTKCLPSKEKYAF